MAEVAWNVIAPVLAVVGGALAVLIAELFLRDRQRVLGRTVTEAWRVALMGAVSIAALVTAFLFAWEQWGEGGYASFSATSRLLRVDRLSTFGACLTIAVTLLGSLVAVRSLADRPGRAGPFFALSLLSLAGMLLIQSATHLTSLFVGMELACFPVYALVAQGKDRNAALEGALKIYLHGALSSAILLFGIVLLFGATGQVTYTGIRDALAGGTGTVAALGTALVLGGFAAKIGWAPFHASTPDAEQGASPSVATHLGVTFRCAALIALARLATEAFGIAAGDTLLPEVLWTLAALSMSVGCAMAVLQTQITRLFSYLGLAHLGIMSLGLVTTTRAGFGAMLFYLLSFAFLSLGAWAVVAVVSRREGGALRVDDFRALAYRQPVLAAFMTFFLVGLAGSPGTAGFVARLQIFSSSIDAGVVLLTLIALLATVVLGLIYIRVIALMFMKDDGFGEPDARRVASGEGWALGVCAFFGVMLGVFPNAGSMAWISWLRALDWTQASVAFLF